MFLKSKFKDNTDLVNVDRCLGIIKSVHEVPTCNIMFCFEREETTWTYQNIEDREQEYNFILSQLDCRVNDGNEYKTEVKTPHEQMPSNIPERPFMKIKYDIEKEIK